MKNRYVLYIEFESSHELTEEEIAESQCLLGYHGGLVAGSDTIKVTEVHVECLGRENDA